MLFDPAARAYPEGLNAEAAAIQPAVVCDNVGVVQGGATIKAKRKNDERYLRQLELPGMSDDAQEKLFASTVVLLGLGGVGSACAGYLAEAGIGKLVLVDPENVYEEDLNAQLLLTEADIGRTKVEASEQRLKALNPQIEIVSHKQKFTTHNADKFIAQGDVIVDCMGNWQDKLNASDACMHAGKILVHAGVRAFEFQVYVMIPGRSACLRCLFADTGIEDVVSSGEGPQGILGPVVGMAGAFQAVEVIKLICGLGATPGNYLIKFDALRRYVDQVMDLGPRPGCPDCGK